MSNILVAQEGTTELPFYKNRKIMSPIFAAVATLLVTILVAVWPEFPFNDQMVLQFITWIWAAGLGIPALDAAYDQAVLLNERKKPAEPVASASVKVSVPLSAVDPYAGTPG